MGTIGFRTIDYVIFIAYVTIIISVGLWVSRKKKGEKKTAQDYFLAGKALPWWAIGASLIASNISAEQFIGMSGSGFAIGLGIASYEWMAAITLIIVGKFFLPLFLDKKIYTMPQFLEVRYDGRVRTAMAIFWLIVYVFVNLTSVLYLGALALDTIMGVPLFYGITGLALFAAIYSIYGGLKSVAWTDLIQVFFLILGGLFTTYIALDIVSGGNGPLVGFKEIVVRAPEHFNMILEEGKRMIPDGKCGYKDPYMDLPGISVLIGGMWIANLSYWGFNQYIIQRGLAAKSIKEAQKGVIFAGFLKILIPLIVVIPGIVAYVIVKNEEAGRMMIGNYSMSDAMTQYNPLCDEMQINNDRAYPALLDLVPPGVKGVAFAALTAAIVSSLASMINSVSAMFTIDVYQRFLNKSASETQQVRVGRITSLAALTIAVITARPLLGNLDQAFQYIQEFTGFVTPGVVTIFVSGLFWKKAKANAALITAILTIPLSFLFKVAWPGLPFLDRMGIVFLILAAIMVILSLIEGKKDSPKGIELERSMFKTGTAFNIGALLLCAIVAALYIAYW